MLVVNPEGQIVVVPEPVPRELLDTRLGHVHLTPDGVLNVYSSYENAAKLFDLTPKTLRVYLSVAGDGELTREVGGKQYTYRHVSGYRGIPARAPEVAHVD